MTRLTHCCSSVTGFVILFLVTLCAARAQSAGCPASLNVGLRIVQIQNGPKMAVWYPTMDSEQAYAYSTAETGSVALNGNIATCQKFPFIVFSHGYGGCGTQSIFLTEQMARGGYVVAAPDHRDATCSVDGSGSAGFVPTQESFLSPDQWTDQTYVDRRNDLESVIDYVSTSSDFAAGVDPARIGAMGHSLGGYTVIGLAGAWPSWKDSRVKAVLGLSPYALPYLVVDRVGQIEIPVMTQGAQGDIGITPFLVGTSGVYSLLQPSKFFLELVGGNHFEWTNALCIGSSTIQDCLLSQPNARLIVDYSAAFFDLYLNHSDDVFRKLDGSGLADYKRLVSLTSVDAASYSPALGISPQSIVSGFGAPLSSDSAVPENNALPQTLADFSLTITDRGGVVRNAPLYLVSPGQINYVVPPGTPTGSATVTVQLGGRPVATGSVQVHPVSPSVFSADGTGKGVAAAQYLRAGSEGTTLGDVYDSATLKPVPIDLGTNTDQVYLIIYGTGMRGLTHSIQAMVGSTASPLAGPFAHSLYAGLDQVNVGPLPRSLAGSGLVSVVLTVDGKSTNPVNVSIR